MSQTRITLSPQVAQSAEELLQLTGVTTLSNLFSLLITRYGYHLKNSWIIGVNFTAASMQPKQYELPPSPEPLELPQVEDPVIQRLARLIEEF